MAEGLGIFWSIAVEFKYYFLSPLIMAFCHYILKWDLKRVTIFLAALIGLSVYLQAKYKYDEITLIRYLPVFLAGTLISIYEVLLEKKKTSKFLKATALNMLVCSAVCLSSFQSLLYTAVYF